MIQRHRPQIRTLMTLACTLLVLAALPAFGQDRDARVEAGLQKLADATSGWAEVSLNQATGTARFVRVPGDVSKAMVAGRSAQEKAASFLVQHGDVFGVRDAASELVAFEVADKGVFTSVSYQQVHRGVPVFGGGLRVHFDRAGDLVAANGAFVPDLDISTSPRWGAEKAAEIAIRQVGGMGKALDLGGRLSAAGSKLFIYRSGLLQGVAGHNHLVWEVEVVNRTGTVREFVYVDAHFGKVVNQITGIHEALDREVSESSLANVVWTEGDPDPIPGGWAGGSAQQVSDWQDEIDGARESYNFFGSMTNGGYLSYDGAMATMRTVNNDPTINCPNANWNGTSTNYCTGVTPDDVVTHEWAHAYTEYTNGLIYQWQSGALNESYSDIWGESVDILNGRGTDSPGGPRSAGGCSIYNNGAPDNSYRWLMGEDATAFGTAIRDMWHPPCEGDPGRVTDGNYHCSTSDAGGVHVNSGIPNHAYALLVDGGTYNGVTVSAIGITKAARIHWEAQNLLGPASNFTDHADALDTACAALIGATLYELDTQSPTGVVSGQTINAGDCDEVADAAAAVELRTEPTFCNFQPLLDPNAPALCAGGPVSDIHFQDFESGFDAWTADRRAIVNPGTFSANDWVVVGNLPDSRAGSAAFGEDPILGDCQTDIEAGVTYIESPVINIPAGAAPQLAFDHWVATEAAWDGGNLKMSVNGGAFNLVSSARFDFNAYNGTLTSAGQGNDNPLAGQTAFTGTDGGSVGGSWGQSQVDLSALAGGGDDIQLRFEMGLDGCNGVIGWYVDDVRVYECPPDPCGDGFCAGQGAGEDCNTCPADCPSFGGGAVCGNGICESADGENCQTCSADCNGQTGGKPSNRFCCGDGDQYSPNGCGDSRCTTGGFQCTEVPAGGSGSCCGDTVCEGQENSSNCSIDCPDLCGNNTIDPGESCDGTDLGGETCSSQGCTGGTLACDGDCQGFDTSGCTGCGGCVPTHDKEKGPRCSDGLDNDCDGLIDGADPDC